MIKLSVYILLSCVFTFFAIMLIFTSLGKSDATEGISVEIKFEGNIKTYNNVYIDSQNDLYSELKKRKLDSNALMVETEISKLFKNLGLNPFINNENIADLKVVCVFREGKGLPRFGRHFFIKTKYIDFVNVKLLDLKIKNIVGEVEYQRPKWWKDNSQGLLDTMFEKLLGESGESQ